jgi:hypothetical protein
MKIKLLVIAILIISLLVGCESPTTSDIGTGNEQIETAVEATQVPPTETPVPPTDTPVPTPTETPIPTFEEVIKAAGFESVDPLIPVGFKLGEMLDVQDSQSFAKDSVSEFVHVIVFPLPTDIEKTGFGLELAQPNIILEAIVMALQGAGIEAKADMSGQQVGDQSKGVTFTSNIEGATARLDVVLFQRGDVGAIVVVGRPDGNEPSINAFEVAQKLDEKIQSQ